MMWEMYSWTLHLLPHWCCSALEWGCAHHCSQMTPKSSWHLFNGATVCLQPCPLVPGKPQTLIELTSASLCCAKTDELICQNNAVSSHWPYLVGSMYSSVHLMLCYQPALLPAGEPLEAIHINNPSPASAATGTAALHVIYEVSCSPFIMQLQNSSHM